MAYDLTNMNAVLDDLRLPLADLIRKKVRVFDWAAERVERGGGKQALLPVRVGEDTTNVLDAGWIADGGALAIENQSTPLQLTIPYRYYARTLQVSGPTVEAAGESKSQLEDALQDSLELLVSSITSQLNRYTWSGGRCFGFIHEQESKASGTAWEFSGDAQKLENYRAAAAALGDNANLDVRLIDTGDGSEVELCGVSAVNVAGSTITLIDGGGVVGGAAAVQTRVVDGATLGRALAVEINAAVAVNSAARLDRQPSGIYNNLGVQTHFGLNRSLAANATLRSTILSADAASLVRGDIALDRTQILLDTILERANGMGRPNRAFFNPSLRSEMATLFQGAATMQVNVGSGSGLKVDAGVVPGGFSYGGIPFEEDVDCGHGMIVFVQDDMWKVPMLRKGDWDGPTYVVQGTDRIDRPWKQYHNLVCQGPNFCGAIVGLTYPAAVAGG